MLCEVGGRFLRGTLELILFIFAFQVQRQEESNRLTERLKQQAADLASLQAQAEKLATDKQQLTTEMHGLQQAAAKSQEQLSQERSKANALLSVKTQGDNQSLLCCRLPNVCLA